MMFVVQVDGVGQGGCWNLKLGSWGVGELGNWGLEWAGEVSGVVVW